MKLQPRVVRALQAELPRVAQQVVDAVTSEVSEYAGAFEGAMGQTIESAVELALGGFLRLATSADDPSTPMSRAVEGAYALGRGEARSGRTTAALLAAYRVGARVSWRELSAAAVDKGVEAQVLSQFAELVFAYIDELSAASVAGHSDELATTGRVREQRLEQLAAALLDRAAEDEVLARAERADWPVPTTLTAVLVPPAHLRSSLAVLPSASVTVPRADELLVVLVPDALRSRLLRDLRGRSAVVGPTRPWLDVAASLDRALRATSFPGDPVDTEQHLVELVLGADPAALADLRARALAPLDGVRPATRDRLEETLRAWLLHQGRRDDVAAHLHVHPQTVRYRMTQLRDRYGDKLTDPAWVRSLVIALG